MNLFINSIDKDIEYIKNKYGIYSFTDYIYKICGIEKRNRKTNFYNIDSLYFEVDTIENKNDIKIITGLYYYKKSSNIEKYYINLIENINVMINNEMLKDYYYMVILDFSTIININNEKNIKNFLTELLSYDRVLISFYYGKYNFNLINNEIEYNNCYGFCIRYLFFLFNENISECHIRDIDSITTNYISSYLIESFKNLNEEIYLYTTKTSPDGVPHLEKHKKYIVSNNLCFLGGLLGFKKRNNSDAFKEFQEMIKKLIQNNYTDVIEKEYGNYKYGYDEAMLLYYYYQCYNKQYHNDIKIYGDINIDLYKNISCTPIFNHIIKTSNNWYNKEAIFIIITMLYNNDYIIMDKYILKDFEYIADNYGLNFYDIMDFSKKLKDNTIFKNYYNIFHYDNFDNFKKYCINSPHFMLLINKKTVSFLFAHKYNQI